MYEVEQDGFKECILVINISQISTVGKFNNNYV